MSETTSTGAGAATGATAEVPESVRTAGAHDEPDSSAQAIVWLRGLLIWGVVVYLGGCVTVLLTRPHVRHEKYVGAVHAGSPVGVLVGAMAGGLGGAMVFVALLGFGIKLGIEASRTPNPG
jgi:hypothetical protein